MTQLPPNPQSLLGTSSDKMGWFYDVPEDEYHADRTRTSSTQVRKILKSPATFLAHYQGVADEKETAALKFGRTAHLAILEGDKFWKRHKVMPKFVGLTKDGRESEQSAEAKAKKVAWLEENAGCVICTEEELRHLEGMINSVVRHRDAFMILKDVAVEVTGYYTCPRTGIRCRIRPDVTSFNLNVMADVKTTVSVEMELFSRQVWQKRYDFQAAMYSEGAYQISGKFPEFFPFIAIEKVPPYECAVYVADDGLLDRGRKDYERAMDRLAQCVKTNQWPPYQTGIRNLALPSFAFIEKETD
jgi:hypothetical protein